MRGTGAKGLDERRAEFHAAHRGGNDDDLSEAEREQLWQREKERYDAKNQPE
jgi:hypothetical protein